MVISQQVNYDFRPQDVDSRDGSEELTIRNVVGRSVGECCPILGHQGGSTTSAPLRAVFDVSGASSVHEHYYGPVIEGNGMGFGSDMHRSEGKDGKDVIQPIHDSEARWAEVVKGYRGVRL